MRKDDIEIITLLVRDLKLHMLLLLNSLYALIFKMKLVKILLFIFANIESSLKT